MMRATTHDGAAAERQRAYDAQKPEWKARSDAITQISGIYPITRTDGNRQPTSRIWVTLAGEPAGITWKEGVSRQVAAAQQAVPGQENYDIYLKIHQDRMNRD